MDDQDGLQLAGMEGPVINEDCNWCDGMKQWDTFGPKFKGYQ